MSNLNVQLGQNIFDILLSTYGSPELTYKLISENPFIDNIDFDFDANPNEQISWDITYVIVKPAELNRPSKIVSNPFVTIVSHNGQTLFDLVLMSYGNIENLYKMILENSISTVNEVNLSGERITFDSTLVNDTLFYNWLVKYKIVINTGESTFEGKAYNESYNISFH